MRSPSRDDIVEMIPGDDGDDDNYDAATSLLSFTNPRSRSFGPRCSESESIILDTP